MFREEQPRITDLIPKRNATFLLLFLAGLTVVAALEALYTWMPDLARFASDGRVGAFDLTAEGSLGTWFSSILLEWSAVVALLVYSVRRKAATGQGDPRIWLWAAACWFTMSIDEAAGLHEGFKEMMTLVTGRRLLGDGSLWWVMPYFAVLGTLGCRLLLEIRRCWSSTFAMFAVAGWYVTATGAHMDWLLPGGGARQQMLEEGSEMMGDLVLLLAMGLHARYVILEAQGLVPVRRPKTTSTPAPSTVKAASAPLGPPHFAMPAAAGRDDLGPRDKPLGGGLGAAPVPSTASRILSKAERKALRKQKVLGQQEGT
jgi:hypothetical protein